MSDPALKQQLFVDSQPTVAVVRLAEQKDTHLLSLTSAVLPDLSKEPKDVVIDCSGLADFSPQVVRALLQFRQALVTAKKQIRLSGVDRTLARFIESNGLASALKTTETVEEAINDLKPKKPASLDAAFIDPFLRATIKVLDLQATTKVTPGKPYVRKPTEKLLGDISGTIGLTSDTFSGSVVISFPAPTFLKVMSRMLGEEFKELNEDLYDGAGELTNIIFGQAKIVLNEQNYKIQTALPSIIVGSDHSVLSPLKGPRVVVPFESDAGSFAIEICLSV